VSRTDFVTMLYVYILLDFKMFIPKFFDALNKNKTCCKLEMGEFLPFLVDALDESIGKSIIQSLLDYMFAVVPHVTRGTKRLIKETVVVSELCAQVINSELVDYQAFYTEKGTIPPIEVEAFKWNYIYNFEKPSTDFIKLLRGILTHLEDDESTLRGPKITKLLAYLWAYYQNFLLVELLFAVIPLLCLFINAFNWDSKPISIFLGVVTVVISGILFYYEYIKMRAYGDLYVKGVHNWVNLLAILFYIICPVYFFIKDYELTLQTVSVYDMTMFLGTIKMYFD
jgi:hypothetical protein